MLLISIFDLIVKFLIDKPIVLSAKVIGISAKKIIKKNFLDLLKLIHSINCKKNGIIYREIKTELCL